MLAPEVDWKWRHVSSGPDRIHAQKQSLPEPRNTMLTTHQWCVTPDPTKTPAYICTHNMLCHLETVDAREQIEIPARIMTQRMWGLIVVWCRRGVYLRKSIELHGGVEKWSPGSYCSSSGSRDDRHTVLARWRDNKGCNSTRYDHLVYFPLCWCSAHDVYNWVTTIFFEQMFLLGSRQNICGRTTISEVTGVMEDNPTLPRVVFVCIPSHYACHSPWTGVIEAIILSISLFSYIIGCIMPSSKSWDLIVIWDQQRSPTVFVGVTLSFVSALCMMYSSRKNVIGKKVTLLLQFEGKTDFFFQRDVDICVVSQERIKNIDVCQFNRYLTSINAPHQRKKPRNNGVGREKKTRRMYVHAWGGANDGSRIIQLHFGACFTLRNLVHINVTAEENVALIRINSPIYLPVRLQHTA